MLGVGDGIGVWFGVVLLDSGDVMVFSKFSISLLVGMIGACSGALIVTLVFSSVGMR